MLWCGYGPLPIPEVLVSCQALQLDWFHSLKKGKSWYIKWAQTSWIQGYLSSFKYFYTFVFEKVCKRIYFQGEIEI